MTDQQSTEPVATEQQTTEPAPTRVGTTGARQARVMLVLADLAAVCIGLGITGAIWEPAGPQMSDRTATVTALALASAWVVAFSFRRLYKARYVERPVEEAQRIITAGLLVMSAILGACFLADVEPPSRAWLGGALVIISLAVMTERLIARRAFTHLRASGALTRRVALVGTDTSALALYDSIRSNPRLGYDVVGLIGTGACAVMDLPVLGDIDHAVNVLKSHDCGGVIISTSSVTMHELNRLTRTLTDAKVHVALSTSLTDIDLTRLRPQNLDGHAMLYVEPVVRSGWRSIAKRAFDIAVAATILVLTSPIMAIVAIAIRIDSRGPVLFQQLRVGRDGTTFRMLKFRTMTVDAEQRKQDLLAQNEADGPLFKMKDDPRITRVGGFLRKWSIDELPQLWNVLRGDMSMVGPRPALPEEVAEWDSELRRRLCVPPGLTGEWQVSGRSDSSFEQYRRHDLHYVDNWSLWSDLRVCARTAFAVLKADGAR